MYTNTNHFHVLINGRQIDEYQKDGKFYVEGRKGSDYELKFQNTSGTRKKVVFSVDGLNILTGDKNWSKGYVVDPWATVVIPGWRKDGSNVAKFMFSSVESSYNQHNDSGDKNNVGVIGAMVFTEKVKPMPTYNVVYDPIVWRSPTNWNISYGTNNMNIGGALGAGNVIGGGNGGDIRSRTRSSSTKELYNEVDTSFSSHTADYFKLATELPKLCAEDNLGTGWGDNKSFQTTEVSYEFESYAQSTMVIYYDSKTNLIKRGIRKEDVVYNPPEPMAFPGYGIGCPPPK